MSVIFLNLFLLCMRVTNLIIDIGDINEIGDEGLIDINMIDVGAIDSFYVHKIIEFLLLEISYFLF